MDLFSSPSGVEAPPAPPAPTDPSRAAAYMSSEQFSVHTGRSGPIAGQLSLGPHGEGEQIVQQPHGPDHGYLHADRHGNIDERDAVVDWDPTAEIETAYQPTRMGGPQDQILAEISRSPIQMMRTDTPTHTLQQPSETEDLYDAHYPGQRKMLNASVAAEGVRDPVAILHHQGRHIVMDGHHRLLAARLAGHSHVPAQVLDHDAHARSGGDSLFEPYDAPYEPYDEPSTPAWSSDRGGPTRS